MTIRTRELCASYLLNIFNKINEYDFHIFNSCVKILNCSALHYSIKLNFYFSNILVSRKNFIGDKNIVVHPVY